MPAFSSSSPAGSAVGFPAQFGQHISNAWSSSQGDSVVINPTAGSALVCVVIGLRSYDPFDLLHSTSPALGFLQGLNDFNALPTILDNSTDTGSITAVSITANVVTVTVANNFVAGEIVKISGMNAGASFLNGASLTVSTASSTQFTAAFTHANYGTSSAATAWGIVSNVLTVTVVNTFAIGTKILLGGFATGSFLNGQIVTALSASGTNFTATFTHANANATEAGTAVDADTGTASMTAGNVWTAATGNVGLSNNNSDYTVSVGNFTANSSKWSLDGYYPNIRVFYAMNVAGGQQTVNVNTVFEDGAAPQYVAGRPIFDGGVDIHVFEFPNTALTGAADQSNGQLSSAAVATSGTFTTVGDGDLILSVGLMKSGNAFSTSAAAGTTGTQMIASGKCVSTQAHWGIQAAIQTTHGAITPGFANPLGYEMAVVSLALKHS